MENPTHSFRETNLVLRFYELQIKSKTVISWSLQKKKEGIFCSNYFVKISFFLIFVFYQCISVLNTLLEYAYFYISKNITSYAFLLVFNIVESF